jgi:hypothetical protein
MSIRRGRLEEIKQAVKKCEVPVFEDKVRCCVELAKMLVPQFSELKLIYTGLEPPTFYPYLARYVKEEEAIEVNKFEATADEVLVALLHEAGHHIWELLPEEKRRLWTEFAKRLQERAENLATRKAEEDYLRGLNPKGEVTPYIEKYAMPLLEEFFPHTTQWAKLASDKSELFADIFVNYVTGHKVHPGVLELVERLLEELT